MGVRHFLKLDDLSTDELKAIIVRASELKQMRERGIREPIFRHKTLVMIFDKSSTRTRVSFEAAMAEGGGHSIFLPPRDSQFGRGEPVEDAARVLSRMADAIMIRTFSHEYLEQFSRYSSVPIINGLTDSYHPCQLLADMQTYREYRGDIAGKTVAWIGDGNNMCHSYINASRLLGFKLNIACPDGYEPSIPLDAVTDQHIHIVREPRLAVAGATLVVTDVWASMGQEKESQSRLSAFEKYQVDEALMRAADSDALFMHCLPAHRGEEVAAAVIDAADSVVWDEAGNRLHAQKALLEFLLDAGN